MRPGRSASVPPICRWQIMGRHLTQQASVMQSSLAPHAAHQKGKTGTDAAETDHLLTCALGII